MNCKDNTYHCLCAYLLDGELDPETLKSIRQDPKLCPKCNTCNRSEEELKLQQIARSLVQKQSCRITVPDSLSKSLRFELGRAEEYRESGIQALDLIRWGTHIAQFYKTRDEVAEVLVPYMEEGLKDNELCVWIIAETSKQEAIDALAAEIPSLQKHIDKSQLQLFSYKDWYLSGGDLNVEKILNKALNKCQEALSEDYSGLRLAGNICWLEQSDWDSFMEYESLLDNAVPHRKVIVTCVYKETQCNKSHIIDVMDRHKHVISKVNDSWMLRESVEIE